MIYVLLISLQARDGIGLPLAQEIDRLAAELGRIKAIELHGRAAALGVADFAHEDRGFCRFIAALAGEVVVRQSRNENLPQGIGGAAEDDIAGRIKALRLGAQLTATGIDDPLGTNDNDILL